MKKFTIKNINKWEENSKLYTKIKNLSPEEAHKEIPHPLKKGETFPQINEYWHQLREEMKKHFPITEFDYYGKHYLGGEKVPEEHKHDNVPMVCICTSIGMFDFQRHVRFSVQFMDKQIMKKINTGDMEINEKNLISFCCKYAENNFFFPYNTGLGVYQFLNNCSKEYAIETLKSLIRIRIEKIKNKYENWYTREEIFKKYIEKRFNINICFRFDDDNKTLNEITKYCKNHVKTYGMPKELTNLAKLNPFDILQDFDGSIDEIEPAMRDYINENYSENTIFI